MSTGRMFNILISQLLTQYKIENSYSHSDEDNIYAFELANGIKINILADKNNYLHMVGFLGQDIQQLDNTKLVELLDINRFSLYHPIYVVGLHRETKQLTIHTRQSLAGLNSADIFALFEIFVDKAAALQRWLNNNAALNWEGNST
ncbi:CesT family type III secretion system chaperone [Brenneria alni]|nr:CesT family type III secretion system chaperone [Brenneria alni]